MPSPHAPLLIVDDDPYDVKLLERSISRARMMNPVATLGDGEQAIRYLEGEPPYEDRQRYPLPALMLLDLKLPRLDGFKVLQWMQARPVLRDLPVVVLTQSNDTPDIERAFALGANCYLVKPVAAGAMVDLLKKVELFWLVACPTATAAAD